MKKLLLAALIATSCNVQAAKAVRVFVKNWPQMQAFQAEGYCLLEGNSFCAYPIYEVPLGYRAVIENVSVRGRVESGKRLLGTVSTSVNDTMVRHYLDSSEVAEGDTSRVLSVGQETKIYADPNTLILVTGGINDGVATSSSYMRMSISGYLEELK